MPTSTEVQIDLNQVKLDAKAKLKADAHKKAVAKELERLRAKKGHILPKKVVFQWPVRLEDHYKPKAK